MATRTTKGANMMARTPKAPSKRMSPNQAAKEVAVQAQNPQQQPMLSPAASTPRQAAKDMQDVTHELIAERAYQLWRSQGGSEMENWLRAEQELRGQQIVTAH